MFKKLFLSVTILFVLLSLPTMTSANVVIQPYDFSKVMKEEFGINSAEINNLKVLQTETNQFEYLTTEEVEAAWLMIDEIYPQVKHILDDQNLSEHMRNQSVSEVIKQKVHENEISISPANIGDLIPGPYQRLNDAEKALGRANPFELVEVGFVASAATTLAEAFYSEAENHQGNGDAFRHSYWNALMVQELAFNSGAMHGVNRAKAWADAHETTSSGLDKEMDLINNEMGRQYAAMNFSDSRQSIYNGLLRMVDRGTMVRIVNDQLTATNSNRGK